MGLILKLITCHISHCGREFPLISCHSCVHVVTVYAPKCSVLVNLVQLSQSTVHM